MNFIKYFVVVMLFAVTGSNVMADGYDKLGGKDADFGTVSKNLKLVESKGGTKGTFDLTLDVDILDALEGVSASQFSKKQNFNGAKNIPIAGNTVAFVQDIYSALKAAALDGRGEGKGDALSAARLWLRNASEVDRKITLNLANRGNSATLISDNATAKAELATLVKWNLLETRDMATILDELNGTEGAKRPATEGAGEFANAQAAYDAWKKALDLKATDEAGAYIAAKDVLAKAEGLRIGDKKRTLEKLADVNKVPVVRAKYDAMKEEVLAQNAVLLKAAGTSGATSTNSQKFGEELIKELAVRAGKGKLKPLQATDAMKGLGGAKYDQASLEALDPNAFAAALIKGLLEMNQSYIKASADLRDEREKSVRATSSGGASKRSGATGTDSDDDGMPPFDD